MAADRHLLFGLLALQTGLIDQAALFAAFHAWTRDKARSLADHLTALGHLDAARRAAVEALVALHVEARAGDVEKSLAAVPAGRSTRESLARIADADIAASISHLGTASTQAGADADCTASYGIGTAHTDGLRYRVLRPHASGGLGAVFVALDTELHREVALKQMLDQHADDPVSRHRFVVEAEITGGLEHPGIAPVYGLGTYSDGRPFYAMRFIRGDSLKAAIDRYHGEPDRASAVSRSGSRASKTRGSNASPLAFRQLLRRFIDVCNAVDYAHSRGVVHRDIKPANVVLGNHGETLVLDWGLAKATGKSDHAAGERTLLPSSAASSVTLGGSALGTPSYMSPEQAIGDIEHLGPRSDIYSLGATLYCLLTGHAPFEGSDVGKILRAVESGDFRSPRALDPTIDPPLEAVCLKAMALRPDDRYATPKALADDAERWIADEPVSAWREPLSRRARRWARRNKSLVTAASAAVLMALAGLAVVLGVQARANSRLQAKNQALSIAQQEIAAERDTVRAINTFLVDDLLAPANPENNPVQGKVTVLEILDRAAERVAGRFNRQPQVEAAIRLTIATTYRALGEYPKAEPHLRAAVESRRVRLGPDHPETIIALDALASLFQDQGRLDQAEPLFRQCLESRRRTRGPEHSDSLQSLNNLALVLQQRGGSSQAETLFRQCLDGYRRALGPEHDETLVAMQNLGNLYSEMGRNTEAEPLLAEAYATSGRTRGPDYPVTLTMLNNLATVNQKLGRLDEAEALFRRLLARRRHVLGERHHHTLLAMNNLALLLSQRGKEQEAEPLLWEAVKIGRDTLGEEHPATLTALNNFGTILLARGKLAEAERVFVDCRNTNRRLFGIDSNDTLTAMNNLARVKQERGALAEAKDLFQLTVETRRRVLGREHPSALLTASNLGNVLLERGEVRDAERLLSETVAAQRKAHAPGHPDLAASLRGLGLALTRSGNPRDAEPLLRESLEIRRRTLSAGDRRISLAETALGECLVAQQRFAEAEPLLVQSALGLLADPAATPIRRREAIMPTISLYDSWRRSADAAAWRLKLLDADFPVDAFEALQ
jgi:serine/threonine protein kinase/Tfp pilus assembly protein PilF